MATKWNDVRDKFVNLLKAELYVEVVDVGSLLLRRKRAVRLSLIVSLSEVAESCNFRLGLQVSSRSSNR